MSIRKKFGHFHTFHTGTYFHVIEIVISWLRFRICWGSICRRWKLLLLQLGRYIYGIQKAKGLALRKESHTSNMNIQLEIIYERYGQYMTLIGLSQGDRMYGEISKNKKYKMYVNVNTFNILYVCNSFLEIIFYFTNFQFEIISVCTPTISGKIK